jgi:MFS superfamily sulfate permease-like transporter
LSTNRQINRFLPFADRLFSYQKEWLRPDLFAGLTPAAVVIPNADEQAPGMQSRVYEFQIANGRLLRPAQEDFPTEYATRADVALPRLMICRLSGSLYYANAESLMNEILSLVRDASSTLRSFILRFDSIDDVDCVAAKMLMELADRMAREQVALVFAGVSQEVEDLLSDFGVVQAFGSDKVFTSIDTALAAFEHLHLTPNSCRRMA